MAFLPFTLMFIWLPFDIFLLILPSDEQSSKMCFKQAMLKY